MIGVSRENLNRCLKDWERHGIVNLHDGVIVLTNPAEFEKLAEAWQKNVQAHTHQEQIQGVAVCMSASAG